MQHITFPMSPVLLVPDCADIMALGLTLSNALTSIDPADLSGAEIEYVPLGRRERKRAITAFCRIGNHDYYPQLWRTQNLHVCSQHTQAVQPDETATQ